MRLSIEFFIQISIFFIIFIFFSSRRRHTRYWRDWSSDVCSSDLVSTTSQPSSRNDRCRSSMTSGRVSTRSEERRVGKECRSWTSTYHKKKNIDENHNRSLEDPW